MGKRVPSYCLHKATGRGVVRLNGRDVYFGAYDDPESRRAYDKLISEWLASGRSTAYGQSVNDVTIASLLADYMTHAKEYYGTGPSSEFHRFVPVVRTVLRLYGTEPCVKFGVLQYRAVREDLIGQGLSRTYINALMKRIKRIFTWGASHGVIPASIVVELRTVEPLKAGRTQARETEAVSPVELSTIEATCAHLTPVLQDMVQLQLLTGCRPGELVEICPGMVDRSKDVWEIRFDRHKTAYKNKQRTVYCGPKAQAVLAKYLLRGADEHCFSPRESEQQRREQRHAQRKTDPRFGNSPGTNLVRNPQRQPGTKFRTQSYGKAILQTCRKHSIAEWSPNQIRHTTATQIREQFGLAAASNVLGHSGLEITLTYAEQSKVKARQVAREVG